MVTPVVVEVCGYENPDPVDNQVLTVTPDDILKLENEGQQAPANLEFDIPSLFKHSNVTNLCTIQSYTLTEFSDEKYETPKSAVEDGAAIENNLLKINVEKNSNKPRYLVINSHLKNGQIGFK